MANQSQTLRVGNFIIGASGSDKQMLCASSGARAAPIIAVKYCQQKGRFVIRRKILLAHLSRRLIGELIGYSWSGVWPSVRRTSSTISNFNISTTSCPIVTKFYLKHHCIGGKDALGFGPDRIRTLVSMATDSSHRVIMGKML